MGGPKCDGATLDGCKNLVEFDGDLCERCEDTLDDLLDGGCSVCGGNPCNNW